MINGNNSRMLLRILFFVFFAQISLLMVQQNGNFLFMERLKIVPTESPMRFSVLISQFYQNVDESRWGRVGTDPDSYRVLYPLTLRTVHRVTNIPHLAIERALRVALVFGALCLMFAYLNVFLREEILSFAGSLLLAFYIGYAMNDGYLVRFPQDLFTLVSFILGAYFIKKDHFGWLMLLLFVSTINRETVSLLIVGYAFVNYDRMSLKEYALRIALLVIAFLVPYGVRYLLPSDLRRFWVTGIQPVRSIAKAIVFLVPCAFLAFIDFKSKPLFLRRMAWIVPFYVGVHVLVGCIREVRLFLPLFVVFIPLMFPAAHYREDRAGDVAG